MWISCAIYRNRKKHDGKNERFILHFERLG